ncbi:MAG: BBE domain-containing protein [Cyanobacteria bacterium P01_D01_bin.116]
MPFSRNDWMQHFGSKWDKLVSLKHKYDPDNILNPGQEMF